MHQPQFLVMAPDGRDANVITSQLGKAGMSSVAATGEALLAAIANNRLCGAILTIEALLLLDQAAFKQALSAQAPWSDCPLIVLTLRGDRTGARAAFDSLGNVTVLERPLHPQALVRAARQALRARARQHKAETYLRDQEAAEAKLRTMAETLETRVIARTIQLSDALAERAAITRQLQANEEEYRLTFELSNQIPWSVNADGVFLSIAERWQRTTGETIEAVTPQNWAAFVHPDDVETVDREWLQAITHGAPFDVEFRMRMFGDAYRWHRARAAPVFGADHSIVKWYGTTQDIDESRQAETRFNLLQAELAHLSRVSAMGAMASTLAHELNQPLTATTNFLRGIRRLLEREPGGQHENLIDAVNSADRSAARAGEIVRRLRDMVSRGGVARRPEPLGTLIREACALALLDAALHGISHVVDIADENVMIDVDRVQIQQVLLNLLRNAVEALGQRKAGEITITARSIDEFSEIVVSDNGPGIPAASINRLFESFNTSKPDGMGIGLSISRTIIEAHGGHITCDLDHAPGAVFRFTVPNVPVAAPRRSGPALL